MSQPNPLPGVPLIESPFFARIFADPAFTEDERRIALDLNMRGYAVIDVPDPEFAERAERIKANLGPRFDLDTWRADQAQYSLRLQDAWEFDADVKALAAHPAILELLSKLYGKRAWPFQTLNFPVGTQQHYHTDAIHFHSMPERFMCGVWIALEDILPEAGPLMYFPRSHKWPVLSNEHIGLCVAEYEGKVSQSLYEPMWRELVEAHQARPETFLARKGQALIWAANLMHGGMPHQDRTRTRWSQVTHYFFEDCAYYTPMLSDPAYGRICFRELRNIATGELMPNRYAGQTVPPQFIAATDYEYAMWNREFDGQAYLEANPDVAAAGVDPLTHFNDHGRGERRPLKPRRDP
ncbi:phytanoyl-CoA dioxygenase family protein [Massilia sp. TS11]|uniref:phytanoyl-CoA dioxygenase family protein n=1 Tax=Massilia sp. TS11 TaxID=2908003 RepID=UPI001EDB772B|nr:phytanoyl-CoA dioxygenase family protein [Massilia sp. TS11]MCG2584651.1 phytanoyl-CoA dioxygenase family protein [Massilia sp. TS11]